MGRPLVISVSGVVGSGKSTVLKHVLDILRKEGIPSEAWQFQRLPCFTFRSSTGVSERSASRGAAEDRPASTALRGRGYRRKSLTASVTLGYLFRIAAFRIYRGWPRRAHYAVSNRYFYDNLAHYEIASPRAAFFRRAIAASMPRPDVAILLTAGPSTLAARRPNYAAEYLTALASGYESLLAVFPELLQFRTDGGEDSLRRIEEVVRERLNLPGAVATSPVAGPARRVEK